MGDVGDNYRLLREQSKRVRATYGVECPMCKRHRPKANATILLPQQRCRIDGYIDPRPELTDIEWRLA